MSYEIWALLGCMTDAQWLWPVVKEESKQVATLKKVIDRWLQRNVQRANEGSFPLTFPEIWEILKVNSSKHL